MTIKKQQKTVQTYGNGVISYGSGWTWRKEVVNPCLEFMQTHVQSAHLLADLHLVTYEKKSPDKRHRQ